jgi:hypothetical protein
MSPNAASPRPRSHRRGASHLSLVTDETPAAPAVADDEGTGPKHAAPAPRMVAGSATMRALIGLGAILSAFGLSFGKAQALEAAFIPDASVEAEPEVPTDAVDDIPAAPADNAPATTGVPAQKAAAKTTAAGAHTTPGTWNPTVTLAATRTYTVVAEPPHGRHRGQADRDESRHAGDRPTGRHRRSGQHGAHNRPRSRHDGATRPAGKAKGITVVTGYDVRSV